MELAFYQLVEAHAVSAGDPSHFYDWMQVGECPKELRNCDAANFIK
jgi:hypothetical protein